MLFRCKECEEFYSSDLPIEKVECPYCHFKPYNYVLEAMKDRIRLEFEVYNT